jgi:hypothetical protein
LKPAAALITECETGFYKVRWPKQLAALLRMSSAAYPCHWQASSRIWELEPTSNVMSAVTARPASLPCAYGVMRMAVVSDTAASCVLLLFVPCRKDGTRTPANQ